MKDTVLREMAGHEFMILADANGITVGRGEQGLQLFARHPVDLILLDLKMPGMDGLAVLRELRQRNSEVPILLLTAYATRADGCGSIAGWRQ